MAGSTSTPNTPKIAIALMLQRQSLSPQLPLQGFPEELETGSVRVEAVKTRGNLSMPETPTGRGFGGPGRAFSGNNGTRT